MRVPEGLVGWLLGKGAAVFRQIQEESGATMSLVTAGVHQFGYAVLTFCGDPEAVRRARFAVKQRLEAAPTRGRQQASSSPEAVLTPTDAASDADSARSSESTSVDEGSVDALDSDEVPVHVKVPVPPELMGWMMGGITHAALVQFQTAMSTHGARMSLCTVTCVMTIWGPTLQAVEVCCALVINHMAKAPAALGPGHREVLTRTPGESASCVGCDSQPDDDAEASACMAEADLPCLSDVIAAAQSTAPCASGIMAEATAAEPLMLACGEPQRTADVEQVIARAVDDAPVGPVRRRWGLSSAAKWLGPELAASG